MALKSPREWRRVPASAVPINKPLLTCVAQTIQLSEL